MHQRLSQNCSYCGLPINIQIVIIGKATFAFKTSEFFCGRMARYDNRVDDLLYKGHEVYLDKDMNLYCLKIDIGVTIS